MAASSECKRNTKIADLANELNDLYILRKTEPTSSVPDGTNKQKKY